MRRLTASTAAAAALCVGRGGTGQTLDGAVVRGDATGAAMAAAEGGAGAVTSLDLRQQGRTAESLGDLVDRAPGVHIRRMGDGLAAQSVTLRGAPGGHVTVALDGVVLNDGASDGVDLSLLAPALLERVDVHRGSAPLGLGVSGLGGALALYTRILPPRATLWATAGLGAFGARRAAAMIGGRAGPWRTLLALGFRATDGDFAYYDDGGTPLNPGTMRPRRNNEAEALDLLWRACRGDGATQRECLTVLGGWRERGVAGVVPFQSDGPFARQRRLLVRLDQPWRLGRATGGAFVSFVAREDRFANDGPVPLGYGGDDRTATLLGELGSRAMYRGARGALEGFVRLRAEDFSPTGTSTSQAAARQSLYGALEGHLGRETFRAEAGVGTELLRDRAEAQTGFTALVSPRAGLRWRPHPALLLRATAGWYQRAPSLAERFGDRGALQGDPNLRPERALNADLGAVLTLRRGALRVRAETSLWARSVRDLIVLQQTSRGTLRPFNLDGAAMLGAELELRATLGERGLVRVSYGLTDARINTPATGLDGLRVPLVAAHDLAASLGVSLGPARLEGDVSWVSSSFLDRSNRATVPGRTLVGASVTLDVPRARGLSLRVAVTNLLDQRTVSRTQTVGGAVLTRPVAIQDVFGFPLPGRAVFASLAYDLPL
jgi:outer membrane receptor protein involved in Fe transport